MGRMTWKGPEEEGEEIWGVQKGERVGLRSLSGWMLTCVGQGADTHLPIWTVATHPEVPSENSCARDLGGSIPTQDQPLPRSPLSPRQIGWRQRQSRTLGLR